MARRLRRPDAIAAARNDGGNPSPLNRSKNKGTNKKRLAANAAAREICRRAACAYSRAAARYAAKIHRSKPPAFCVPRRRATVLRAGAAAKRSDCSALTLSEKRNAAAGISGRAEEKAAAFPVVLGKNSGGPAELRKKRRFGQGQEKNSGGWRMVRRTAGCVSVRTEKRRSAAQRASGFCAAGRGKAETA